jgi:hypothetical protein
MSEREDNIERRYMALKSKPGAVEKALGGFHRMTERTYKAFHEIIQEHADIGKAAIVIMASNQAAHLISIGCDEDRPRSERIHEISAIIAPMFELMYDRLTRETIERLDEELEEV